jgi:L-aspartate oxidase
MGDEGLKNYRYLIDFDMMNMDCEYHDVVIIGSGIAGVYTSLKISEVYDINIFTKETIDISNSVLAQGGIAVPLDKEDSPGLHFKDTIYAGAGLCDEDAVWTLVNEAADNIKNIVDLGVVFDRENDMELALSREAAHSKNRIIHAGDYTGKAVCDRLVAVVKEKDNITIRERCFVIDLLVEDGRCRGIIFFDEDTDSLKACLSNIVICATGGFGQLYANTTNPEVATGDGVALAYRAGAGLMDLEFIQFHPTVLFHPENKSFLISEAVRGEGAVLRNTRGERFMQRYHELKELAPRDVVSRAIFREMQKTGSDHVYLDITFKSREELENRFPNIFATCLHYGIDISEDRVPVAPAEHYCMGGIRTDVFGRTNIKGFYACGEAACNGIHGANRLASNSLLEGLVFGNKIGKEVSEILAAPESREAEYSARYATDRVRKKLDKAGMREEITRMMSEKVGIIRNREGLLQARDRIRKYGEEISGMKNMTIEDFELQNIVLLASLVIESALAREESRGAHYRSDFSESDDINWKRHIHVISGT